MASCVKAVAQPDGSQILVLDTVSTDLTSCVYVVESGAELGNSLLSMTAQDGATYSGLIVSIWVVAYGMRSIINIFRSSET